jgi:hypothetical protein
MEPNGWPESLEMEGMIALTSGSTSEQTSWKNKPEKTCPHFPLDDVGFQDGHTYPFGSSMSPLGEFSSSEGRGRRACRVRYTGELDKGHIILRFYLLIYDISSRVDSRSFGVAAGLPVL